MSSPNSTALAILAKQQDFLVNMDQLSMYQFNFDENSPISMAMKRFFAEEEAKTLEVKTQAASQESPVRRL